jgi:hypothetical protein
VKVRLPDATHPDSLDGVPVQWGTMAKRYNEKKVRKELRRVEKAALKDLKKADKNYLRSSHDADNPLIKVPLKLLWSACVSTIFIIVWVVVGWFALGVWGFSGSQRVRFGGLSLSPSSFQFSPGFSFYSCIQRPVKPEAIRNDSTA